MAEQTAFPKRIKDLPTTQTAASDDYIPIDSPVYGTRKLSIHRLPGGGGGTDVEANPEGTPTDTLNTIGISGTIYDIAGSSNGVIEGLDYDRADNLNIPDFTGYTYTPTEDGVLMLKGYGAVGGVAAESTGNDTLYLAVLGDTWTNPWIPVNKGTEYTLKRMAQDTGFPSGSWLKFIPWKRGVFLAPMIYSETEREVGAWLDDKPLYQKTIVVNYPSGVSSGEHVVESIADIGIVNAYGHYIETSSGYDYTIPYAQSNGSSLYYYQGDMYFAIGTNVGFGSGTLYLTVLYTKDNDTAGSGSYGSLGIPMVHYDDSEKVIGTWFGETVYEKTFSGTISGTNTAITTNLNIGRLVDIEASGEKTSGGSTIRFGMDYRDGSDWLNVHCSGNNIRIICSSWFSGADIKVTLRYTKSTT